MLKRNVPERISNPFRHIQPCFLLHASCFLHLSTFFVLCPSGSRLIQSNLFFRQSVLPKIFQKKNRTKEFLEIMEHQFQYITISREWTDMIRYIFRDMENLLGVW